MRSKHVIKFIVIASKLHRNMLLVFCVNLEVHQKYQQQLAMGQKLGLRTTVDRVSVPSPIVIDSGILPVNAHAKVKILNLTL